MDYHSLFLKSDGSLWAMGDNYYGELGDGTFNQTNRPEQIVASNVTAIAAGQLYSLFVKSDGSLWAMGWTTWPVG
jgi:alpha-tubulin suppressor-like RCC1 family protein